MEPAYSRDEIWSRTYDDQGIKGLPISVLTVISFMPDEKIAKPLGRLDLELRINDSHSSFTLRITPEQMRDLAAVLETKAKRLEELTVEADAINASIKAAA